MEKYHLLHNWTYLGGIIGVFLIGFLIADSYTTAVMNSVGAASSLKDIFNGMVYDSTFLLIFSSSILALIFGQEFSCRTINHEICAGHTRTQIFFSKVLSYLVAFNLMVIVYPFAGCLREYTSFDSTAIGDYGYHIIRAIGYSFLLNSTIFLLAIFFCCWFKSTVKAVAVTALTTFALSLFLAYGMMLKLPISFLPIYQIRAAVSSQALLLPGAFVVAVLWCVVLIPLSWHLFRKCDLK